MYKEKNKDGTTSHSMVPTSRCVIQQQGDRDEEKERSHFFQASIHAHTHTQQQQKSTCNVNRLQIITSDQQTNNDDNKNEKRIIGH